METIKLLLAGVKSDTNDGRMVTGPSFSRRLLVFDGESGIFRTVSLRPKQSDCAVCSGQQTRTINRIEDVDYALFCGRGPHDKVSISFSSSCSAHLFLFELSNQELRLKSGFLSRCLYIYRLPKFNFTVRRCSSLVAVNPVLPSFQRTTHFL